MYTYICYIHSVELVKQTCILASSLTPSDVLLVDVVEVYLTNGFYGTGRFLYCKGVLILVRSFIYLQVNG